MRKRCSSGASYCYIKQVNCHNDHAIMIGYALESKAKFFYIRVKCTAISFKCMCFHLVYLVGKVAKLINILHLTTQHQQSINPVRAFRVSTKQTSYM